jgi:predicted NUDIX family phosphoesterase
MSEVLVVDRTAFFGGDWPQGFQPIARDATDAFLRRAAQQARFEPRPVAETTPAWKQWIPYCLLRCDAAEPGGEPGVFLVQRTRGQGEARLHGAWSIGLGGHVEPEDAVGDHSWRERGADFFARSLLRELREELDWRLEELPKPQLVGLINDDSTEVGSVHAGLAYVLHLPLPLAQAKERVGIRETSKMRGGFTHLAELRKLWQNPGALESWSRLLMEHGILDQD